VLVVGLAVHLLAAFFSVGAHHYDEHFQILEFAGLKLGINQADDLAWEFHERMRSSLQPALAVVVIRGLEALGLTSPFSQATVLRIISALLSCLCMFLLVRAFLPDIQSRVLQRWFVLLSFLIWFLPYVHARYSAENWGGLLFGLGLAWLWRSRGSDVSAPPKHGPVLAAGLLLGFAFMMRFQVGLMVAGLVLWLIIVKRERLRTLFVLHAGIVGAILVGVVVDRWFYGHWTFTAWNYVHMGLFNAAAPDFGASPWWTYISVIVLRAVPPFSLVIIAAVMAVWIGYRRHVVSWITIPFLIAHLLVGHKELRFLFPLVNIVPLVLVLAFQLARGAEFLRRFRDVARRWRKPAVALFWSVNTLLLLVACLKPADNYAYFYKYVYDHYASGHAVLAYTDDDPYRRVTLNLNFFRPRGLRTVHVPSAKALDSLQRATNARVLFASNRFEPGPTLRHSGCIRVYRFLPPWVQRVNYTNWLDRTAVWTLYDCDLPPFHEFSTGLGNQM
jgi:phosphatidylinositol glycan class B